MREKNGARDVVDFDAKGNLWSILLLCDILQRFGFHLMRE
jgi:hypothetical protein